MYVKAVPSMCRPGMYLPELQPGMGGVGSPEQDENLERMACMSQCGEKGFLLPSYFC